MTDKGPQISKEDLDNHIGRTVNQDVWEDVHKIHENEFWDVYIAGHQEQLLKASQAIDNILEDMEKLDVWEDFRSEVKILVSKTTGIKRAVCLALGIFIHKIKGVEGIWTHQYAAFAYICRAIDDKQKRESDKLDSAPFKPIKRCFQDPKFDTRTEYLLTKIERKHDTGVNFVMEPPDATDIIDEDTFLYAIHIEPSMWRYILRNDEDGRSLCPQVMITNCISEKFGGLDRDRTAAEQYHKDCALSNRATFSKRLDEMEAAFKRLSETHAETAFPLVSRIANLDQHVFNRTSIFQKVRDISSQEQIVKLNESRYLLSQNTLTNPSLLRALLLRRHDIFEDSVNVQ
ncbi:hypothetical protein D6D15_09147 [Aureobasidium pullulans]|uniref:SRR1-like domain-containing protein n=1 Tax=Aureobasidium pullulans TaxID=5580 RepID=A0A4S9AW50_AURPU|nr:hypothetical protein D6D15_09147 [Aureobasidium pullulans]